LLVNADFVAKMRLFVADEGAGVLSTPRIAGFNQPLTIDRANSA
jgi:hypothetical protein